MKNLQEGKSSGKIRTLKERKSKNMKEEKYTKVKTNLISCEKVVVDDGIIANSMIKLLYKMKKIMYEEFTRRYSTRNLKSPKWEIAPVQTVFHLSKIPRMESLKI